MFGVPQQMNMYPQMNMYQNLATKTQPKRPDYNTDPLGYAMSFVNEPAPGSEDENGESNSEADKWGKYAEQQSGNYADSINMDSAKDGQQVYSVTSGLLSHINDLSKGDYNSDWVKPVTTLPTLILLI